MTTDKEDDYSHNAWLVLMHENPMGAAMAAHLLRKERDEAVQALADVRTLDEWAHDSKKPATCVPVVDMGGNWRVYLTHAVSFLGVTADEARAKAAAWVRGLK